MHSYELFTYYLPYFMTLEIYFYAAELYLEMHQKTDDKQVKTPN